MDGLFFYLIWLVYFGVIIGILYMIYRWVTKFLALKQEHNDLLREIIRKMDQR